MIVHFDKPVRFSTFHRAFTGEGIPAVPSDARTVRVSEHTTVHLLPSGEAWECFDGAGTTEHSETYYWPDVAMCHRQWAKTA